MAKRLKWEEVFEGSKKVSYCQNATLPPIIINKDKTYTVKAPGEKPMTYKEWDDAEKRAIDIGKRKAKEIRDFNRKMLEEQNK